MRLSSGSGARLGRAQAFATPLKAYPRAGVIAPSLPPTSGTVRGPYGFKDFRYGTHCDSGDRDHRYADCAQLCHSAQSLALIAGQWGRTLISRARALAGTGEACSKHLSEHGCEFSEDRAVEEDLMILALELNQGWGPLCAFLGVRVPEAPFPLTNAREEFAARAARNGARSSGQP
jgi:hypothetical protein